MIYGYARVSTADQDCDMQIQLLNAAGCQTIKQEKCSGIKARPVLQKLLRNLKAGDVLVFYKLDRLARSLSDLLRIIETVQKAGASIRSLTEPISTETAAGRFVIQLFGALAEFERCLIKERTISGMKAAQARGKTVCFSKKLTDKDLNRLRELWATGRFTQYQLAIKFGVTQSTISKRLRKCYTL